MIKIYIAKHRYKNTVEWHEVESIGDCFVKKSNGRKAKIETNDQKICTSFEEAKKYVEDAINEDIRRTKNQLSRLEEEKEELAKLTEDDCERSPYL